MPAADVRIEAPDLARFIRSATAASRASGNLLRQRLRRVAEPLKDAVIQSALAHELHKAAASTGVRIAGGQVSVRVEDRTARYARFSGHTFRHPVFANPGQLRSEWTWAPQYVPGFWAEGIENGWPLVWLSTDRPHEPPAVTLEDVLAGMANHQLAASTHTVDLAAPVPVLEVGERVTRGRLLSVP
jgi:hypothetical protein